MKVDGHVLNKGFNDLLAKHGIPVGTKTMVGDYELIFGSTFNDVVLDFDVTIPAFGYFSVAVKIKEMFTEAGLHTFADTWAHLGPGGEDLLHINGIVV